MITKIIMKNLSYKETADFIYTNLVKLHRKVQNLLFNIIRRRLNL